MRTQLRTVLAVFVAVTSVVPVSVFAQADRRATLILARSTMTAVGAYDATAAVPAAVELPGNLVVTSLYRPVVDAMLRQSPTFRRQCERIAAAPRLLVTIETEPPLSSTRRAALTLFSRYESGRIRAQVRIAASARTPELIAHELEHVLEQIDGVDLRAKAQLPASGVRSCQCGDNTAAFETARAVAAGRRVARELERRP